MLALGGRFNVPKVRMREAILAQRRFVPVLGFFMTPLALTGYVMALWRVGADLNWLGEFFIGKGLLSRWQVWLAIGIAIQLLQSQLNRLENSDDQFTP